MASTQHVYQTIKKAQELDSSENESGAYQHYLFAVQQMTLLLQYATPNGVSPQNGLPADRASKLFKMAVQCLEQAESLFTTAMTETRGFTAPHPTSVSGTVPNNTRQPQRSGKSLTTTCSLESNGQHGNVLTPPTLRPHSKSACTDPNSTVDMMRRGQQQPTSQRHNIQTLYRISPMDAARRKNRHLMAQYQANLRKRTPSVTSQNISLNYLRRLEENRSIAKMTEQNMAKKLRQRESRLQENTHKYKQKSIDSLSWEKLQEEVTTFEQGKVNLNTFKQQLTTDPNSTGTVVNLIHAVLNMIDHPLCKLFGECQYSVVQYIQIIVKDIEKGCDLPKLTISPDHSRTTGITSSSAPTITDRSPGIDSSRTNRPGPPNNDNRPPATSSFDDLSDLKLATLRAELMGEVTVTKNNSPDTKYSNLANDDMHIEDSLSFVSMPQFNEMEEREDVPNNRISQFLSDDDNVFDSIDGGGMSKGTKMNDELEIHEEEVETEEHYEEIIFRGLTPLCCDLVLGNRDIIGPLSKNCIDLLREAIKLIHSAFEKLINSFCLVYPQMTSGNNLDTCHTTLETMFFPAIMPMLTSLYRCGNYDSECKIATNMATHVNATPKDLSVRKKFLLHDQDSAPYSRAIDQLRTLPFLQSPTPKLDCVVMLSKSIVQCIEDYYKSKNDESVNTAVGVDDILPIMTYIIIRSGMPQLFTECAIMKEFIQESYMMGEEGFCLTTFDTALRYVGVMSS